MISGITGKGSPPHKVHPIRTVAKMQKFDHTAEGDSFDYGTEAELFSFRVRNSRHHLLGYRRYARAVDATRFAIEALSPQLLIGTYPDVDEVRFEGPEIRSLYDSADNPPARPAVGLLR